LTNYNEIMYCSCWHGSASCHRQYFRSNVDSSCIVIAKNSNVGTTL